MESEWETEIQELLDSLTREPLDELLKEIAEARFLLFIMRQFQRLAEIAERKHLGKRKTYRFRRITFFLTSSQP